MFDDLLWCIDLIVVTAAAKGTLSEETVQMFLRQIGMPTVYHISCVTCYFSTVGGLAEW